MPIYGDLVDISLQDLLALMSNRQKSGHLTLRTETDEIRIAFDRGRIATVTSNIPELRLGRLLVEHGSVSEDRVDQALALQEAIPDRERVGDLLAALGFVTQEQIARAVAAQFEASLFRILTQRGASFTFFPAEVVTNDPVVSGISFERLIANVIRQVQERPPHTTVDPPSVEDSSDSGEVDINLLSMLSREEAAVLHAIWERPGDKVDVAAATGLSTEDLESAVESLVNQGLVVRQGSQQIARAAT